MIFYILGIITGLLISCFIAIILTRFRNPIERTMSQTQSKVETLMGKESAYIIGLSEEEQAFKDSLNIDGRDTKLN
jgi:C4-dicarboxylate transporter